MSRATPWLVGSWLPDENDILGPGRPYEWKSPIRKTLQPLMCLDFPRIWEQPAVKKREGSKSQRHRLQLLQSNEGEECVKFFNGMHASTRPAKRFEQTETLQGIAQFPSERRECWKSPGVKRIIEAPPIVSIYDQIAAGPEDAGYLLDCLSRGMKVRHDPHGDR